MPHREQFQSEAAFFCALRDWFAGQALAGFISQSHTGPKNWTDMGHGWGEDCANDLNCHQGAVAATVAGFAYAVADAMLIARASLTDSPQAGETK